jgi:hypothetical protein
MTPSRVAPTPARQAATSRMAGDPRCPWAHAVCMHDPSSANYQTFSRQPRENSIIGSTILVAGCRADIADAKGVRVHMQSWPTDWTAADVPAGDPDCPNAWKAVARWLILSSWGTPGCSLPRPK